jgi:hypothetical protein
VARDSKSDYHKSVESISSKPHKTTELKRSQPSVMTEHTLHAKEADLFLTYQQNVHQYLNIREQTNGTVSLVFESNEAHPSMVAETLVHSYLSKCLSLPKEKVRVLSNT